MIELTSRLSTTLDRAAIERLIDTCGDGGTHMVAALLDTLFTEAPHLIATLGRAVRRGDADATRLAAHTLKSHGLTFGAPLLAHVARELEHRARDHDLAGAAALVGEIEAEYSEAQRALETLQLELTRLELAELAA